MQTLILKITNTPLKFFISIWVVFFACPHGLIPILNFITAIGDSPSQMEINANNIVKYGFIIASIFIIFALWIQDLHKSKEKP